MEKVIEECTISSSLSLVLGLGRFFGTAPVLFSTRNNKTRIRVSSIFRFYGYLLILVLDISLLMGLTRDWNLEPEKAVRTRTPTLTIIWVGMVFISLLVANLGVCAATKRMNCLIHCLILIEKMSGKTRPNFKEQAAENRRYYLTAFWLIIMTLMPLIETAGVIYNNVIEERDLRVLYFYSSYNVQVMIEFFLTLQFVAIAFFVINSLKAVNLNLDNQFRNIDSNSKLETFTTKTAKEKVLPFVQSFCTICEVVEQLDTCYGLLLLLLLASSAINLVTASFYLISYLYTGNTFNLLIEMAYCLFRVINVMVFVEPGHQILNELANTPILISQLIRRTSSLSDPIAVELDKFMKQTTLNQVSFSPMGLCTITRSLATEIFSAATTYLIIIMQFKRLNQ